MVPAVGAFHDLHVALRGRAVQEEHREHRAACYVKRISEKAPASPPPSLL